MATNEPAGYPEADWDAARDFLLAFARNPENIKALASVIGEAKSNALQAYVHKRLAWDRSGMPCGHLRKYWEAKGSAEAFVADPVKNGYCLICFHVNRAIADWAAEIKREEEGRRPELVTNGPVS